MWSRGESCAPTHSSPRLGGVNTLHRGIEYGEGGSVVGDTTTKEDGMDIRGVIGIDVMWVE